jgi:hypothetical protein
MDRPKRGPSYGQWGGRPPHCHSQTGLKNFSLSGFSATGLLSSAPCVDQIVTVTVYQAQIGIAIVGAIAIKVMDFDHVLGGQA